MSNVRRHMPTPFSHLEFRTYAFESIPLERDVFLMDECWMAQYEAAWEDMFNGKDYPNVGYISYAAVRRIGPDSLELSWYPNVFDRFHEVSVVLPRDAFVTCVDSPDYDEKPHIFVKSNWLSELHLRPYSAFALIDAIGVKSAILRGQLGGGKLVRLRNRIDDIAATVPSVAFVSFADSLLLKANWYVGQYDSAISYSYEPESLIQLLPQVADAFRAELDMPIYAAIAQGVNEYEDPSLVHTSATGNHISLNSLGLPFAQLLSIDNAARQAIRAGRHGPSELYIEEHFYHSLRFRYGFDKQAQKRANYNNPLSSSKRTYFCLDRETVLSNLDPERPLPRKKKRDA
jgi:hypothetical protein